jgi:hypothetical protein
MRNVTHIQRRLIELGYLPPVARDGGRGDDGKFGHDSLDAYNHFRASVGKGPVVQASMAELNADLFPEDQPAAKPAAAPKLDLSTLLKLFSAFSSLKKGKTMTSDQLTGVLRAILAIVSGYFIAKGVGSADVWNWVIAGVTGVIPFVWGWWNNRPKVILPLGK